MTKQTTRNKQASPRRFWEAHVRAQHESGLSRAEYGRQYNLSYHALTYWNRKLSPAAKSDSKKANLVPVSFGSRMTTSSLQSARSSLAIILPGKIAVEVGDNFSSTTLTRLLATLERR